MSSNEKDTTLNDLNLEFDGNIPFLEINGPAAVETVRVAAEWAKGFGQPEYFGRNALIRVVDLKRVDHSSKYGYTDRGIVTRIERAFTKRGKTQVQIARLATAAYHESYNHKGEEGQRLRLIEHNATTAIDVLRTLSEADPDAVDRMWTSPNDTDPIETARSLVSAIDAAYENPKQLSE